jgi:hypothetical protein
MYITHLVSLELTVHILGISVIQIWTFLAHSPVLLLIHVPLLQIDRLCGLVVRVLGYRSGGLASIPGTTRKKY